MVLEENKGRSPEIDISVGGRSPGINPCWRETEILVEWLSDVQGFTQLVGNKALLF